MKVIKIVILWAIIIYLLGAAMVRIKVINTPTDEREDLGSHCDIPVTLDWPLCLFEMVRGR